MKSRTLILTETETEDRLIDRAVDCWADWFCIQTVFSAVGLVIRFLADAILES